MGVDDMAAIDDWGFSDATHADLQRLLAKYPADVVQGVLLEVVHHGERRAPEDLGGFVGTAVATGDGTMRVFRPGDLWWMLLEHLREVERRSQPPR